MNEPARPEEVVRRFLAAWQGGTYRHIRDAYETFLSPDCIYENSGLPPCTGMDEILRFIDVASQQAGDAATIVAEIRHLAVAGDVVLTERTDRHYDLEGNETLTVPLCGAFEVDGDRIRAWRDYFDPRPLLGGSDQHTKGGS